jgi:DNA-binding IclR family transcriptional regulator
VSASRDGTGPCCFPTGSPSTWITETYEVARNTARRALAVLREDGLIMTVPQRGSYVL